MKSYSPAQLIPTPETKLHSEEVFASIMAVAKHPRTRRSAENLRHACDFLTAQKAWITISGVGARCGNMDGGPKTQSIQNNKLFKAYVLARAAESGPESTSLSIQRIRSGKQEIDNYIDCLEYELHHLRGKLKEVSMVVPRMGDFDKAATYATGKLILMPISNTMKSATFPHPDAAAAVSHLLNSKQLQKVGLEINATGQLIARDRLNYILLQRQEVEALRAFVDAANIRTQ